MVLISHKYKFIYLKTNKTASSSVEHFFTKYCVPDDYIIKNEDYVEYFESDRGIVGPRWNNTGNISPHITAL